MYSNKKQHRHHYADSTLTLGSLCSHVHHSIHQDFLLLPVYSVIFFSSIRLFIMLRYVHDKNPQLIYAS